MIYTILSEPRTGSTNLYRWFKESLPDYIVVTETSNPISIDFRSTDLSDLSWVDRRKNHIINEKFTSGVDMSKLISISDKIICLFREDEVAQTESMVIAEVTKNWGLPYYPEEYIIKNLDTIYFHNKRTFLLLKKDFKELREKYNLKSFSYEDLYYRNKITELQEYLNLHIGTPFPYGEKYRIDVKKNRLI